MDALRGFSVVFAQGDKRCEDETAGDGGSDRSFAEDTVCDNRCLSDHDGSGGQCKDSIFLNRIITYSNSFNHDFTN
jgi:hypothetical protein